MNRRGFLKGLFGGAAAATAAVFIPTVLDPERELWVPGSRSFFIPDGKIAIRNVQQATLAEQAAITGQRMLRVKHWGYDLASDQNRTAEMITLIPEKDFDVAGRVAFQGHPLEVHFDDGTVAYNVSPKDSLAQARANAQAAKVENQRKVAAQRKWDGEFYPSRVRRTPDNRAWTRHDVKKITDTGETLPVISLTDD